MNERNDNERKKGGRKPKSDPAAYRYSISLTAQENSRFLTLFGQSGMNVMAHFITACIFQSPVKTIKIDRGTADYYMRLTTFYGQFRAIGVNYNQMVKLLYQKFSEKKAAAYLYRLERQTIEMATICQKIIELTQEFEIKHHLNENK